MPHHQDLSEGFNLRGNKRAIDVEGERNCMAEIYLLAGRICQFAKVRYVIEIGDSFGAPLVSHFNQAVYLSILSLDSAVTEHLDGPNVRVCKIDFNNFLHLDDEILKESIIIWPKMDLHIGLYPGMVENIASWVNMSPFVILSHSAALLNRCPTEAEALVAFEDLLQIVGAGKILKGRTNSRGAKDRLFNLALGGTHAVYQSAVPLNVLAVVSCFNDADIILDVARHLVDEGVKMHFIDNWSTDGTWEALQELAQDMPEHVVALERFPSDTKDDQCNWFEILRRKEVIAQESPFDWFIHYDSDELRTSCWPQVRLADALGFIDSLGYNVVNHFVIDFRPTQDGFGNGDDAKKFFEHFEFNNIDANVNQFKAWKKQGGRVDLASSGGHIVVFPERRVYPLCFLLQHFSLRSTGQARRKIYIDRIPRVVEESFKRRYHGHYKKYAEKYWLQSDFLWDPQSLIKFDPSCFHADFFVKRLTGA